MNHGQGDSCSSRAPAGEPPSCCVALPPLWASASRPPAPLQPVCTDAYRKCSSIACGCSCWLFPPREPSSERGVTCPESLRPGSKPRLAWAWGRAPSQNRVGIPASHGRGQRPPSCFLAAWCRSWPALATSPVLWVHPRRPALWLWPPARRPAWPGPAQPGLGISVRLHPFQTCLPGQPRSLLAHGTHSHGRGLSLRELPAPGSPPSCLTAAPLAVAPALPGQNRSALLHSAWRCLAQQAFLKAPAMCWTVLDPGGHSREPDRHRGSP